MSDSEILWKFLLKEYPNEHPFIYFYVCGNVRSPKTATQKMINEISVFFHPAISEETINSSVKDFLEHKKKQYLNGEINVKSIY